MRKAPGLSSASQSLASAPPGAPVVCNGYKDADYVRLALRATQLGRKVVIIVEKPR